MIIAGRFSNGDDACNFLLSEGFKITKHENIYRQAVRSDKENALKGNYNFIYCVEKPQDVTVESLGKKVIFIDTVYEICVFRKNGKIIFLDVFETVNYPGSEQGHWLIKDADEIVNLLETIRLR